MNATEIPGLGEEYYARAKAELAQLIESDERWSDWTTSPKRYMLVSQLGIVENDVDGNPLGLVTGYLDLHVSSDSAEDLKRLWVSRFIQQRYETSRQHFIVDTKERKVVEFLSVCA
jgi:hypothetical protein